ncbi:imidazole glycerol phosphate synthase subunit HisH [Sandarakinorhabdus limnophila]|uniref:imidazole glycerol phosphate synthase subunit HisH n=1 Tax=Sandarakinorhabdus limnophila TaxID=210512 RepID=UPI0026EBA52F|nr:imidazole glycerol phosphate synthase subunit HisH [Sandarakinorhabdus limnophila]
MPETLALVDYGAGNLRSAARALARAGARVVVTDDPAVIAGAARIVLPGVGAFAQCIGQLREKSGIEAALNEAVNGRGVPFLGICVGMQLLASEGHEHGVHKGLGWLPGKVERLTPSDPTLKIPHMGWNRVEAVNGFDVPSGDAYFVHSYAFTPEDAADVQAVSDHGGRFAAIVKRGHITGVQFHPEKSQAYGLAFLSNWLSS